MRNIDFDGLGREVWPAGAQPRPGCEVTLADYALADLDVRTSPLPKRAAELERQLRRILAAAEVLVQLPLVAPPDAAV
ncbi:MAG TPA: hypothetical protein VLF40_00040 [Candidatus Saccharimonadales bacterium]|nr:hypothetical protein [Candidatus Saccharimonadales bacterium]